MKNKLLALLVVAAVLCWTVGAMAVDWSAGASNEETVQENAVESTVSDSAEDSFESLEPHQYAKNGTPETWYANNTVGALGLPLKDLNSELTDKWYNIVPVDLTVEGSQTIPLVASGLYHFGSAVVEVAEGNVTVIYNLPSGLAYLQDECLQWFTAVDQITTEFLENPTGEFSFGEPVSIKEQLNDQDVALLFICNHVTYRQPITYEGAMLTRYYEGLPEWVEWRAGLTALLEKMEAQAAERAAALASVTDLEATATDLEATATDLEADGDEENAE